jgi:ATP-dependent DNA helicase PIF1
MMIKNVDDQLVNGTVGKVVDFMTESEWTDSLLASGRQPDENPDEKDKPRKPSTGKKLPVVEWKIVGSRNPRVELVRDETFKVEGPNNKIEASRTQVSFGLLLDEEPPS